MINTVLCEADEICNQAAFACQKSMHAVNLNSGEFFIHAGDLRKCEELKGLIRDKGYRVESYFEYLSESDLIYNINSMIGVLWNLGGRPEAAQYNIVKIESIKFFLSPANRQDNFRFAVATIKGPKGQGYKAGRGEKPKLVARAVEYLIDVYGAIRSLNKEADDEVSIHQTKETLISSFDKDLCFRAGMHYNAKHDMLFYVPSGTGTTIQIGAKIQAVGLLAFYQQLLTGDAIDNIPGVYNPDKFHHKNPPNFSHDSAVARLNDAGDSEEDYLRLVIQMYRFTYKDKYLDALYEIADLIWIMQDKHETGRQYIKRKIEEFNLC